MAFVMLRLKRQGLTFHVRRQQCRRIFGRCTPRTIRIAAFLVVKNYVAADFSACLLNLKIDAREVVHFPFPDSGERRLRMNRHGRLQEKEHYKACKCGDDRHLVGFDVLTLNNKTIESGGFVYGTCAVEQTGATAWTGADDASELLYEASSYREQAQQVEMLSQEPHEGSKGDPRREPR